MKRVTSLILAMAVIAISADSVMFGERIRLREEERLLNGTWEFTTIVGGIPSDPCHIPVPEYWNAKPGFHKDRGIYKREVNIPPSWSGKVIKVEFEGVNHIANVYFNNQFVTQHIGGWIPFSVDITNYLTMTEPNQTFTLKVDVKGGSHWPIVDAIDPNKPLWPVGWYGHQDPNGGWGIMSDVWLRAYGKAHINDAFIQTSYRNKTITVDYELLNMDTIAHTVNLEADIIPADSNDVVKTLGPNAVVLPANMISPQKVTLIAPWAEPDLWTPDSPNLYILKSRLRKSGDVVDEEARRFGFREIWISGDHYKLNGVRLNLYGDSMNEHQQHYATHRYDRLTRETCPNTVDVYLYTNVRWIRFHMGPIYPFVLDICDEKGLMVMDESAIYARDYMDMEPADKDIYMSNSKKWIKGWIKARRNHPSIMI